MRVTNITAPALLFVVLALFTAGPAMASPDDVVRDCADDGFVETDRHSRQDLRQGRNRIPADLDAYSDCKAQIDEALDKPRANASGSDGFPGGDGAGGGNTTGGSGSTNASDGSGAAGSDAPLTEEEAAAAERKRQLARADTESLLGDRNVNPGTAGAFEQANTANGISLPLLLAIIALVLGLAAGAVVALRRRNPELFAGTLGRVPFPRGLGSIPPLRRRR